MSTPGILLDVRLVGDDAEVFVTPFQVRHMESIHPVIAHHGVVDGFRLIPTSAWSMPVAEAAAMWVQAVHGDRVREVILEGVDAPGMVELQRQVMADLLLTMTACVPVHPSYRTPEWTREQIEWALADFERSRWEDRDRDAACDLLTAQLLAAALTEMEHTS